MPFDIEINVALTAGELSFDFLIDGRVTEAFSVLPDRLIRTLTGANAEAGQDYPLGGIGSSGRLPARGHPDLIESHLRESTRGPIR
jgi:hypothetical protein